MTKYAWLLRVVGCIGWIVGCGYPRPPNVGDADAGGDGAPGCAANQILRCESNRLVRCNGDGTAEITETCALGCSVAGPRCNDIDPSNNLAPYLDLAAGEPDLDLGTTATINAEDGTVMMGGNTAVVKSVTVAQTSAPAIRIFIVRSLAVGNVTVTSTLPTGSRAIAIVSHGDLQIDGVFTVSANLTLPGAGGFNDASCQGSDATISGGAVSGAGGGGFSFSGGRGGSATTDSGNASGGAGGTATGNATLVPLRGGCDGGKVGGAKGSGGGAIQLVSRTRITVSGIVAANGSSGAGGGSGGGVLLEAPIVDVTGSVVANGGAGAGGCILPRPGADGRLDATPATGGLGCSGSGGVDGGNGGAQSAVAGNGASINRAGTGFNNAFGGYGGGSVGRIRVNTAPGGLHATGVFSPNPSTGTLATR